MLEYYIDLGSSTIKMYKYENKVLTLTEEHSIYFKNDFDEIKGISANNKEELFKYVSDLKHKYNLKYVNTHILQPGQVALGFTPLIETELAYLY